MRWDGGCGRSPRTGPGPPVPVGSGRCIAVGESKKAIKGGRVDRAGALSPLRAGRPDPRTPYLIETATGSPPVTIPTENEVTCNSDHRA